MSVYRVIAFGRGRGICVCAGVGFQPKWNHPDVSAFPFQLQFEFHQELETVQGLSEKRLRDARIHRLERLADALDSRYRIPGIGVRFGWDSILGLVPGIGDTLTLIPGLFMISEGAQIGIRNRVLARMAGNVALDAVVGGIPVLGDIFDVAFKAHRRNIALLKADLHRVKASGVLEAPRPTNSGNAETG